MYIRKGHHWNGTLLDIIKHFPGSRLFHSSDSHMMNGRILTKVNVETTGMTIQMSVLFLEVVHSPMAITVRAGLRCTLPNFLLGSQARAVIMHCKRPLTPQFH